MKNFLLGVGVTNATEKNILEYIVNFVEKKEKKGSIVTPNPEILVYAHHHPDYKLILNRAEIALCDGVGVAMGGKIVRKPFKQRITGVDFMENLCKEVAKRPITVGFLGGGPKIAEKVSECLQKKYPGLKVGLVYEGAPNKETAQYIYKHVTAPIDILFVAFGFPRQEIWIDSFLSSIPVILAMGVGGSFDYLSGNVLRGPYVIRAFGLEWLFRLFRQPWRLKRQLALLEFLWLIFLERFTARSETVNNSI